MMWFLIACTTPQPEAPPPTDPPAPVVADLHMLDGCWVPPHVLEERTRTGELSPSTIGLCVRADGTRRSGMWTDDRPHAFPGAMTLRFETHDGTPQADAFVAYKKVDDVVEAVNAPSRLLLTEARENHVSYGRGTGFPTQLAFDRTGERLTVAFSGPGPDSFIQLEMELALDKTQAGFERGLEDHRPKTTEKPDEPSVDD